MSSEIIGVWRKLHNWKLYDLYSHHIFLGREIKQTDGRGAMANATKILLKIPKRKRRDLFLRFGHKREDNIKMHVFEIGR
jgi:hypothetical protein